MSTLPERLQRAAETTWGSPTLRALLSEAAQSLQAQEVVKETTINHARDPHCCGCYVIRWNDGDPVAVCGECGVQVALLDRLVSGAPEGEWVLVPREPTDEMVDAAAVAAVQHMTKHKQRLRLGDILRLEYAAHLSAAPSPSAAQGEPK